MRSKPKEVIVFEPTDNRYYRCYMRLMERAKHTKHSPDVYIESHHIVPWGLGGWNITNNLVALTAREHFIAHRLLPKFLNGKAKAKMVSAVFRMFHGHQGKHLKVSSRVYARMRQEYGEERRVAMSGRVVSAETREKLSRRNKGKVHTEESKKKQSIAMMGKYVGRKLSQEQKSKISQSLMGHKKNAEWVRKINNNPEKIRKMAETHRGMKRSEESKQRMSDAAKGRIPWNAGVKNPDYNLKWYHDPLTKVMIRVPEGTQPDGYLLGKGRKWPPLLWFHDPVTGKRVRTKQGEEPTGYVRGAGKGMVK